MKLVFFLEVYLLDQMFLCCQLSLYKDSASLHYNKLKMYLWHSNTIINTQIYKYLHVSNRKCQSL